MNFNKGFQILFFLFFAINIFGQKDSTKVYIYEPFHSQKSDIPKNNSGYNNCIKWNWSLLGRGVFALNYEKSLSSNLTFEIGAGLTYRDLIYEAIKHEDSEGYGSGDKVTLGQYAEGSLRIYPKEGDLEGFFVSPLVRYRSYNVKTLIQKDYYSVGYKLTDVGFNIGMQSEQWLTGILLEWYFGVAYRYAVTDIVTTDINNAVTTSRDKAWTPALMCGFKVGIPF